MAAHFLWGGGSERPDVSDFTARSTAWWQQYTKGISLSASAKKELQESSRNLVALLPNPLSWTVDDRPFRGLVVGAVQSGKTASMIGLSAMALDQGYRIVIVLSGNKDDLRRQTARRFNTQLLRHSDPIPGTDGARTMSVEETKGALSGFCLPYDRDAHQYAALHNGFQSAITRGDPAVIVIKKHQSSLTDVRRKLEIAYERIGVASLPTLILDDECDEASVDRDEMLIPGAIANLWRREGSHPRVAYVGYTATSAANLLQNRANELFPSDFVYMLRYSSSDDSALTFAEPTPDLWYTGGQTYYEAFGDEPGPNDNFLVVTGVVPGHAGGPVAQNPSILEAIRAFVVGGAYRLALQPDWSLEVPARFPSAHTMLVQTSASQRDHKAWLDGLVSLFGGTAARGATDYGWSSGQVANEVASNEQAWRRWYDEMVTSRTRVLEERPRVGAGGIVTWDQVKALIPAFIEVLRIKVVNSDEDVAAELDFAPRIGVGGTMGRPQDLFVIVIGGTKLSRGLTLDGLSVTYFTRWNPSPTEDTVLQLCRWYGYRGRHLEFCRLFTTEGIFDQLTGMEENDRALRQDLARLMREGRSPADAALVIAANPKALPTGKLGEGQVHDLAFSPFTAIFRHVESSDDSLQARNQDTAIRLVGNIRAHAARRVVAASGAVRGFCSPNWTALEVAGILDGFQYADHNPTSQGNPAREHFRVPDGTRRIVTGRTLLDDPYQVAAYLRQWAAEGNPPVFNVGVAFGEMTADVMPFDFPLVNREIRPNGEVIGGWTGRRSGWRGDQLFDGPAEAELVPGTAERRPNARGLVLMYVIHKDAVGRHGRGSSRPSHTPFLGIVIPEGGPIWRRVTVDRRRIVTA